MARLASVVAIVLIAGAAAFAADRPPGGAITPAGALTITLPADLLRSREVHDQLTSGLTTVFVITVNAGDAKGAARIDVRFALWEEQFVVDVIDATGEERRFTFDSDAAFGRWWRDNPLTVTPPHRYGRRTDVEVKLKMLPFSAQEQRDTRRWLARALGRNGPADVTPSNTADILRVLVETSVRRRPLLERTWSFSVAQESPSP